MFFSDSDDEFTHAYSSESPSVVFNTRNGISEEEEEENNTQSEDVLDHIDHGDFTFHGDYNTINMELDNSIDYTSEDEEEEEEEEYSADTGSSQTIETHTRHHYRSSSQRSRAFSPLVSRLASFRRQNYNFSPVSSTTTSTATTNIAPIKFNPEVVSKTGCGNRSKESEQFTTIPRCSFLHSGLSFSGTQNLMNSNPSQREEWGVKVTIQYVDYKTGTAIGLMEALNVPSSTNKVVTYWEGEIIDLVNHSLWTNKWQATPDVDLQHWRKFEAFRWTDGRSISRGFLSRKWFRQVSEKYIFMRWKERCFVDMSAQDSGLTIAGFYYICIRRSDGTIEGYYFDPVSTPYQKLTLKPVVEGTGLSFAEFSFH
ncbi:1302_t:CDS:2 [Ambispora leptoticha]|uniref:1302_t:CDS:1 n=1 Tax=Ambispora leptoticha TaxID=144679 RepID=A0A9N9C7I8_9GLOM|nr:1302_t:CDS:2 [Ambispora leptoticha]